MTNPRTADASAQSTLSEPFRSLQFQYRSLDTLVQSGRRARVHTAAQIDQLTRSIERFGFAVPILVDEQGVVLAGHARIEAARRLKMQELPIVVLSSLSSEEKRAFVLAENRLAELAGWDKETLKIELEELSSLDLDFDLTIIGFSSAEIDAIVLGGEGGGERGDAIPTAPDEAISELGDLWVMGEHKLYCGDALAAESLKSLLGCETVRAVFTDPPYNVPIAGHVTNSRDHGEFVMASGEMTDEEFTAFLERVWAQIYRALVEGGLVYLCMDWRHVQNVFVGAQAHAFEFLNLIVWDKKVGGMGSFYRSRHELIFQMKKPGGKHTNRVELGKNGRDRANVWAYEGVGGFGAAKARARQMHPTVKPLALVRDAILDCTERGDLVLDLFCGSGTTIIAAESSKRRGRAIELDPKYVDVSVTRWQDYAGGQAVLAATGETWREVRSRRLNERQVGRAA